MYIWEDVCCITLIIDCKVLIILDSGLRYNFLRKKKPILDPELFLNKIMGTILDPEYFFEKNIGAILDPIIFS